MTKFLKAAPWLTRPILIPPTFVFAMISFRYLAHPVQAGAAIGLAFNAPLAITIVRVGFGAFPLGCSLFTLSCLLSRDRLLIGLGFVATIIAAALVVRVFGMLVDNTVSQNLDLVRAEVAMLFMIMIGTVIELRRRRIQIKTAV
jgi:hypothetical protein